jgi:hypothetical protein
MQKLKERTGWQKALMMHLYMRGVRKVQEEEQVTCLLLAV